MAITLPPKAQDFVRAAEAAESGTQVVTFNVGRDFLARFDALTKRRGVSRAAHIKMLMATALSEAERAGEI